MRRRQRLPAKLRSQKRGTSLITKHLVVGRQIYYSATRAGLEQEEGIRIIDLELPLRTYWESERLLKHADYLIASAEDGTEVRELYSRLLRLVATYAITEKDRNWIFERLGVRGPASG